MKFKLFLSTAILLLASVACFPQDTPIDVSRIKGYTLGPGDQLEGKVLGEKDYEFNVTVNEDGMIEVPFSEQPIAAKCKTEREMRETLTGLLKRELKNPQLSLRILQRNSRPPASISGEVNVPQQLILLRKVTLLEMLNFAGGIKEEAGGSITVFRPQAPICMEKDDNATIAAGGSLIDVPYKVYSLASVRSGADDSNPVIYPGDVIVVEKAPPVYVVGEVVAPQGLYLKEGGMTLTEAIAKLGGVRREAKTKDVKIYRLKPNSRDRETISANYDLIKKGQQKDILLMPNDVIEVDKAKDSIALSVLKLAIGTAKAGVNATVTGGGYRIIQ